MICLITEEEREEYYADTEQSAKEAYIDDIWDTLITEYFNSSNNIRRWECWCGERGIQGDDVDDLHNFLEQDTVFQQMCDDEWEAVKFDFRGVN